MEQPIIVATENGFEYTSKRTVQKIGLQGFKLMHSMQKTTNVSEEMCIQLFIAADIDKAIAEHGEKKLEEVFCYVMDHFDVAMQRHCVVFDTVLRGETAKLKTGKTLDMLFKALLVQWETM